VCLACGSSALKRLRVGVTRAAEELSALVGRPVSEVSGPGGGPVVQRDLLMGTEAVLHRVGPLDLVAFVDFDQELLAPRYRAGEDALAMLGRAARLVGGRRRGGRLLVQTRLPEHPALLGALLADYERWARPERELRAALRLPPSCVLARLSGEGAGAYVAGLVAVSAGDERVQILGPSDGQWLLKADSAQGLADLLATVARPPGQRLRVEVGPRRV
jgi:primosomal protein N' (replication factor Y)